MKTRLLILMALLAGLSPQSGLCQDRLLIVAPDEFTDDVRPLKRFKEASGRPTDLLSLSYVTNTFSGMDDAEKVKRCIAHYEANYNTRHVLLVGDVDRFPVRYRWWGRWLNIHPAFTGDWQVISGEYVQRTLTNLEFRSWVDVGAFDEYVVDVDCTRLSGNEIRLYFASGDRQEGQYYVEMCSNLLRIALCKNYHQVPYTFAVNQDYELRLGLTTNNITVWVNGTQEIQRAIANADLLRRGKIALATHQASAKFDNFQVMNWSSNVLWNEGFNDGTANSFTSGTFWDERHWASSDLYFADLYEQGTLNFETWDTNNNGLYAEIQFQPDGTINQDHADLRPDVAVGRIPASTNDELAVYVHKVIAYESATTPNAPWFKKAGLYTGSWLQPWANSDSDEIGTRLVNEGFSLTKRYWTNAAPAGVPGAIIDDMNAGLGFVNYYGHGNASGWACVSLYNGTLTNLNNAGKLPVVFGMACDTGMFAYRPVFNEYVDSNGVDHLGGDGCEALELGAYPHPGLDHAACIQIGHDAHCFAEKFLFGNPIGHSGAIAYLGARSGGQSKGRDLDKSFFKALDQGERVLGELWKYALEDYHSMHNLANSHTWSYSPLNWEHGHTVDEPQKYHLFGDPSLLVGGAFTNFFCGTVYDGSGSPWTAYSRNRLTCDIIIPSGQVLTGNASSSTLFENGRKITALGTASSQGLVLIGSPGGAVVLMSALSYEQAKYAARGMKVEGQFKLRNGGQIKLY